MQITGNTILIAGEGSSCVQTVPLKDFICETINLIKAWPDAEDILVECVKAFNDTVSNSCSAETSSSTEHFPLRLALIIRNPDTSQLSLRSGSNLIG